MLDPVTAPNDAPTDEIDDYTARKLAGICTYGRCNQPAALGVQLCARHRRKINANKKRSQNALRAERREAEHCRDCGKPSKTYRCPACFIRDGRVNSPTGEDYGEDNGFDQWRRDANGWQRYRGKGRRGAPGAAVNDEQISTAR